MKKVISGIIVLLTAVVVIILAYNYRDTKSPNSYYKIYLNDEVLGVIQSKDKLERYIDAESEVIKKKYNVNKVYAPAGLVVEELSSYNQDVIDIEDVFRKINARAELTIEGYQITIKKDDNPKIIYVTEEDIFTNSVLNLIKTFVGSEKYESYINDNQNEIIETGSIVENVYVQNDITIKAMHIPVDKTIYSNEKDLSSFLLYGEEINKRDYTVKIGDTISSVSLANEISTEEFLISNPKFKDKTNLLHAGEVVSIAATNPQIEVVLEEFEIVDKDSLYQVEERYDETMYVGSSKVLQEGQNGLVRVSQNVQTINGQITYVDPVARQELKPTVAKIIVRGSKIIPHVGDLKNWAWPAAPGGTITNDFTWRINPVTGKREHHSGVDISGTGYGSPVYAANNGTVERKRYDSSYGYHIVINHNNGYYTVYAHLSKFAANTDVGTVIPRGTVIGYVGSTGMSTGPHLHFEMWKDCTFCRVDPLMFYR